MNKAHLPDLARAKKAEIIDVLPVARYRMKFIGHCITLLFGLAFIYTATEVKGLLAQVILGYIGLGVLDGGVREFWKFCRSKKVTYVTT